MLARDSCSRTILSLHGDSVSSRMFPLHMHLACSACEMCRPRSIHLYPFLSLHVCQNSFLLRSLQMFLRQPAAVLAAAAGTAPAVGKAGPAPSPREFLVPKASPKTSPPEPRRPMPLLPDSSDEEDPASVQERLAAQFASRLACEHEGASATAGPSGIRRVDGLSFLSPQTWPLIQGR